MFQPFKPDMSKILPMEIVNSLLLVNWLNSIMLLFSIVPRNMAWYKSMQQFLLDDPTIFNSGDLY